VRISAQGPHRPECAEQSAAFYKLVFSETDDSFQIKVDSLAPAPDLGDQYGTLMAWDGQVDTPEYQEVLERLKEWTTKAINRASAIRDI
jgi:hypothetical protein